MLGLTIGTALGNLGSPMLLVDVVFGSLLTLVAAASCMRIGPRFAALVVPVVVNGLGVAAMLAVVLGLPFWASAVWVGAGEAAVMATRRRPRAARHPPPRRAVRHTEAGLRPPSRGRADPYKQRPAAGSRSDRRLRRKT